MSSEDEVSAPVSGIDRGSAAGIPAYEAPPSGDQKVLDAVAADRPAMWCDTPDLQGGGEVETPVEVTGWAISPAGVERVLVIVDGQLQLEALHGLPRADLRRGFGDERAASCGFFLRLDPAELPPGSHDLEVIAVAADGSALGVAGTVRCVAPPPPTSSPPRTIDPLPAGEAGTVDELVSEERFVPAVHRDFAMAPEHYARYEWAAQATGGKVLDAGCGVGWGTALLSAHARRVVGVDLSPAAVEEARRLHGEEAEFRVGNLCELPFADDSFDAVVSFEAIEHVRDPELALDEMRRVLRPGGLLMISSPNRGIYPEGNPFHLREFTAPELAESLSGRFANVATYPQQTYVASLIGRVEELEHRAPATDLEVGVGKIAGGEPGTELYVVAAASDSALPGQQGRVVLGHDWDHTEDRRLLEMWQERAVHAEVEMGALRTELHYERMAQRAAPSRPEGGAEPAPRSAGRGLPESLADGSFLDCDQAIEGGGLVVHNSLLLSGAAVAPAGATGVIVTIGDRTWNATFGLDTPELAERWPEAPGAARGGYRVQIDTSGWERGPREITVAAYDAAGGSNAIEGRFEVVPFESEGADAALAAGRPAICLDEPGLGEGGAEVEGAVEVCGWAHAPNGIAAVVVTLDGLVQYEAPRPFARNDLLDRYGPAVAAEAGFALRLHPSECSPGRHAISVVAIANDGTAAGVEGEILCKEAPPGGAPLPVEAAPPGSNGRPAGEAPGAGDAQGWRERATLAEADAAASRAQAEIASRQQRRALRELRGLQGSLEELHSARAARDSALIELEDTRLQLGGREAELGDLRSTYEGSLSWRMTRPLRFLGRAVPRKGRRQKE